MKRSDKRRSGGGFTLIEVVVSTALLAVVCTGFLMMTAANAGQLSKEYKLERSNYDLSSMAWDGFGDPTGETITVEFSLEGESPEPYMEDRALELFERYEISSAGEDTEEALQNGAEINTEINTDINTDIGSHMSFYKHR